MLLPNSISKSISCAILSIILLSPLACTENIDPIDRYFKNKKVLFLGNSITQAGTYVSCISYFLEDNYPDLNTEIISIGLSSETVSCLTENDHPFPRPCLSERLDRALEEIQPDVVVACYGMNDGIYHPLKPEHESAFQKGILHLKEKVAAASASLILMTPPPFDPLPIQDRLVSEAAEDFSYKNPYENYDEVLKSYTSWIKTLASEKITVVDLHSYLNADLNKKRETNLYFRYSEDGIHPGFRGHILMAKIFLQELGIPCETCNSKSWVQLNKNNDLLEIDKKRRIKSESWLSYVGYIRGDTVKTSSPKPLLILLAGQSNMVGQGKIEDLKVPPQKNNLIHYINKGLTARKTVNPASFGPEYSLANILSNEPELSKRQIVLLKYAIGGSSLLDWAPDYSKEKAEITGNSHFGNMYETFFQYIDSVQALYEPEIAALLWVQGERDARIPEAGKDYSLNFKKFIKSFRERIGEPDLPIIFAKVNPPRDRYPAVEVVNKAQEQIASEMDQVFIIETEGLSKNKDQVHYDTKGQIELGSRFAKELIKHLR